MTRKNICWHTEFRLAKEKMSADKNIFDKMLAEKNDCTQNEYL